MDIQSLLTVVLGMAGFGAFVSVVVGFLKSAGVVTDGTAQNWVAGFNLLGVVALFIVKAMGVEVDLVAVDANLNTLASVLVGVGQLVIAVGGSTVWYKMTRGSAVGGKSFSK